MADSSRLAPNQLRALARLRAVDVAGRMNLAVMKLAAISHRGLRRDFWDAHEIFTRGGVSIIRALDVYLQRFGKAESDVYHVLRSLTFFDDAEQEALMPMGLTSEHWETIKAYFVAEAPRVLRSRTGGRPNNKADLLSKQRPRERGA